MVRFNLFFKPCSHFINHQWAMCRKKIWLLLSVYLKELVRDDWHGKMHCPRWEHIIKHKFKFKHWIDSVEDEHELCRAVVPKVSGLWPQWFFVFTLFYLNDFLDLKREKNLVFHKKLWNWNVFSGFFFYPFKHLVTSSDWSSWIYYSNCFTVCAPMLEKRKT